MISYVIEAYKVSIKFFFYFFIWSISSAYQLSFEIDAMW